MIDIEELQVVRRGCPRTLSGPAPAGLREELGRLAEEAARGGEPDRYGDGGVVAEVEEQVRELLGAPAAVLLPTGTQAQQVALRFWSTTSARVALHDTAHPVLHEDDALTVVQGLVPVVVGPWPELAALQAEHDRSPLAAVLVELPQRERGGILMAYDELAALAAWCREAGVKLHLDGARLWECGPAYAPRSLAEVVALADSVYVSLYKGLGAAAGAVLLGSTDLAAHTRVWRHRLGGTQFSLWPLALGARRGLRELLPQVPDWVDRAGRLAAALNLEVVVPPVTPLLHVVLPGEVERVQDALTAVSRESGVWLGRAQPGPRPGTSRLEVSVMQGEAGVPAAEGAALLSRAAVLARAAVPS